MFALLNKKASPHAAILSIDRCLLQSYTENINKEK